MANFRMLPPVAVSAQTRVVNGRSYSGAPGVALDVLDFDAEVLSANGWVKVELSGPTSARPSSNLNNGTPYFASAGMKFYDTTLSKVVVHDGANWRDPLNGNSV